MAVWERPSRRTYPSRTETFTAGTARGRVRILHFETAIQRLDVVQFAAGDIQSAFGIHHHADSATDDQDVAVGRPILQIHFVLHAGAASADDGYAQNTLGPPLPGQQRPHFRRRTGSELDEPLVTGPKSRPACGFVDCIRDHSELDQATGKLRWGQRVQVCWFD